MRHIRMSVTIAWPGVDPPHDVSRAEAGVPILRSDE